MNKQTIIIGAVAVAAVGAFLWFRRSNGGALPGQAGSVRNDAAGPRLPALPKLPKLTLPASGAAPNMPSMPSMPSMQDVMAGRLPW